VAQVESGELWERSRPGKWTVGQHVEHLAITLSACAEIMEHGAATMRNGSLPPVPGRGLLQTLWVGLVVGKGKLPRGGRTPKMYEASPRPERAATIARLRREVERFRTLGKNLTAEQRDRLWAPNPFMRRWHYTFPEMLRVQAVHVRHHARLIEEIVKS
jgi:hypothetical protein